jgi:DNA repair exonuclease SbcCD ATPase subunit
MRKLCGLLAVLVVLLHSGGAFAQSSDYEIIESYKSRNQSLMQSIKTAQDPGQPGALEGEINRLEADYAQHQKLLGDGLYPDTFAGSIGKLREQLKKTTERLAMIEESKRDKATIETKTLKAEADAKTIAVISQQNEEYRVSLEKMTREVAEMSAQIQRLSAENTGLVEKIKVLQQESRKDKESIAKLKELTEKLNANIRDRDDLIVKMMDSLFNEYSKSDLTDAQKNSLLVNAQGNDYVGKIIATVDGNIRSVERTVMLPQDVGLIKAEERKVTAKWNAIKPSVGKLYPDQQTGERELGRVDGRLSDWKRRIEETTWKSIQQVFVDQKVDIGMFYTAEEFQAHLLAYLDEQVKNPSRREYQTFKNKIWDSPIKDQWLPVIPTDELSAKQRSDIEERIGLWGSKVSAMFWRWVLIGALCTAVAAAILVVVLRRKKQPPVA